MLIISSYIYHDMIPIGNAIQQNQRRRQMFVRSLMDKKNKVIYNTSNHCVTASTTIYRIYNGQNGYVRGIDPNNDDEEMPAYMQFIYRTSTQNRIIIKNQAQYVADICTIISNSLPPLATRSLQKDFFILETRERNQYDRLTPDEIIGSENANEIAENRINREATMRKYIKCTLTRNKRARITSNNKKPHSDSELTKMVYLNNDMHIQLPWDEHNLAFIAYRGLAALHLMHVRIGHLHMRTGSDRSWMVFRKYNRDYILLNDFRITQRIPNDTNFRGSIFSQNGNNLYATYSAQNNVVGVDQTTLYNRFIRWLIIEYELSGFVNVLQRAFASQQNESDEIRNFITIIGQQLEIIRGGGILEGDNRYSYVDEFRRNISLQYANANSIYKRLFQIPFTQFLETSDHSLIYHIERLRHRIHMLWTSGEINSNTRFKIGDAYPIPYIGSIFGTHITTTLGDETVNVGQLFTNSYAIVRAQRGTHRKKEVMTNIIRYLSRNPKGNQCVDANVKNGTIGGKFVNSLIQNDRQNAVQNGKIKTQIRWINVSVYTILCQLLEDWNTTRAAQTRLPVPDHIPYDEQFDPELRYCGCIQQRGRCGLRRVNENGQTVPVCRWTGDDADGLCIPNREDADITSRAFQTAVSNDAYARYDSGQRKRNANTTNDAAQPAYARPLQHMALWLKPFFDL